jgi:hypothetical protein
MLKYNQFVLERYDPSLMTGAMFEGEIDFYQKVRANRYLGSDDLVAKTKKLLDIIEKGGTLGGKRVEDDELNKIKKDLIDQINLDYGNYMGRLIELTKKPKKWWSVRILRKS